MTDHNDEGQIQIRLVTKQQMYAVPDVPYSVPAKIDGASLNKLLNELLRDSGGTLKTIDFDFLVQNELLRVPLHEHLQERGLSAEALIEIEYLERTPAPEPQESILHEDWVATIKVADKLILTGHYDNTVAIHTTKGVPITTFKHHTNRVKAVSWINSEDPSKGFITTSHDLSAILWHWNTESRKAEAKVVFKGHERGIDSVGVSPNADRFATGGWDTHLKIWSASFDYDDEEPSSKRIKGIGTRVPLHTLKGHKETIAATLWTDSYNVCTASMDHTIKFWDAELCGIKNEIVGQKAYLSASWSPLSNTLITSSADRHIRLYDPRSTEGLVCKTTFTSHVLWVSAVCWSKHDQHLFMSGSYDHGVKLWDTRSPKAPLFNLSGHDDKILCVDWSNPRIIVSGGADNCVHIFKNKQFV